LHHVY